MSSGELATSAFITDRLLPHVNEDMLTTNLGGYSDMQYTLTSAQQGRVEAIKEHLLTVPLVHTFRDADAITSMQACGLQSNSSRNGEGGNTFALDCSTGLDGYTFTCLGQLADEKFGQAHLLIDAAHVLLGNTVVTPRDITDYIAQEDQHKPYDELSPESQEVLRQSYFGRMVRGEDWLEIIARRISGRVEYWPFYSLTGYMHLGEVKSKDTIPSDAFIGTMRTDAESGVPDAQQAFEEAMIAKGLAPPTLVRRAYPNTQTYTNDADMMAARKHLQPARECWQRVLKSTVFGADEIWHE